MIDASLPREDVRLILQLVHTHLNGTVRTIIDRSPDYTDIDSFSYLVEVVLPDRQLQCIAKFIYWDFFDSFQNMLYLPQEYSNRISNFNAVYRCLQQYAIPLPQLYGSSAPSADTSYYCQLLEYLPGQDIKIALNTILEERQPS